jgi:hypothetical protein
MNTTTHFPVWPSRGESVARIAEGASRLTRALALDFARSLRISHVHRDLHVQPLRPDLGRDGRIPGFVVPIGTVTLADDHRLTLEAVEDIEVVGTTGSRSQAVPLCT